MQRAVPRSQYSRGTESRYGGTMADDQTLDVDAAGHLQVAGSVSFAMRSYFSSHWLWGARHFARLATEIENGHEGRSSYDPRHRALVLSSLQASVAFLEAAVNELYQDAADDHGTTGDGYLSSVPDATVRTMAALWLGTDSGRSLRTLGTYQVMLTSAGLDPLDQGAPPYQDAALVVQLRNAVVHYQPETVAAEEVHTLEKQLKGKFPSNSLMSGAGNPWWPAHCLGAGCAQWAVDSVRVLANEVFQRLDIRPNYARVGEPPFGEHP